MKKEFVDYLYEQRSLVQTEIDRLVEICKSPRQAECSDCGFEPEAELRTRRSEILGINKAIEKYFETHSKNI